MKRCCVSLHEHPLMFPQTQCTVWEQPDRGDIPGGTAAQKQRHVLRPRSEKHRDCYLCSRQRAEKHPAIPGRLRGLPAHRGSRGCRQLQPLGRGWKVTQQQRQQFLCSTVPLWLTNSVIFLYVWGYIKYFYYILAVSHSQIWQPEPQWNRYVWNFLLHSVFDELDHSGAVKGSCRVHGLHGVSLLFCSPTHKFASLTEFLSWCNAENLVIFVLVLNPCV